GGGSGRRRVCSADRRAGLGRRCEDPQGIWRAAQASQRLTVIYRLAADLVLIAHVFFVMFVLFGALLLLRWPHLLGWHIAAVLWGVLVEFSGAICPLTP